MKNLSLPLNQSAGYIYDKKGALLGCIMQGPLVEHQVTDLTEFSITAINTLLPNIEVIRVMADQIKKLQIEIDKISDPRERHPLESAADNLHKCFKQLFVNSKLLNTIHQTTK